MKFTMNGGLDNNVLIIAVTMWTTQVNFQAPVGSG